MKKLLTLMFLFAFTGLLCAQEAPATPSVTAEEVAKAPFNQVTVWDFIFGIGYNYRKFHKVKLYKGSELMNYYPKTRGGQTRYDGWVNDPAAHDPHPSQDQEEERYEHPVHIGNSDFGSRECFGSELNIGIPCFRHDAWRVDGLFGLMFYECDTKIRVQGAHTEYDMQLQTYDVGAKISYKFNDRITASVSVGPSFNFTSLDTSSNGHKSDKDSLQVGAFAAAGLQVWLTSHIGVGADIRYDKVFDNASTRYSDLDLDTWNTDFKFFFRF